MSILWTQIVEIGPLKRVAERIHMDNIHRLIDETPAITEVQKDFYKIMISERKAKIIDYSMELLLKQDLLQQEQQGSLEPTQEFKR